MSFAKNLVDYSLYFVTNGSFLQSPRYLETVKGLIESGVGVIQLREKNISTQDYISKAKEIHSITSEYCIPLIINDRVDVAYESGVDGVHVGMDDLSVSAARELLGEDAIIGATVNSADYATQCIRDSADYLGTDAIFFTETKSDIGTPKGLEWLTELTESIQDYDPSYPLIAIGGIDQTNISDVLACGVDCVAVSSGITQADDPTEATKALRHEIDKNRNDGSSEIADLIANCIEGLLQVREKKPMIQNMTPYVVMNHQCIISLGGHAIISHGFREVQETIEMCDSLVLNPGALTKHWVEGMYITSKRAESLGIPVVIDILGARTSEYRKKMYMSNINDVKMNVIKGTSDEIKEMVEEKRDGVFENARQYAEEKDCVVAVSGPHNIVVDANTAIDVVNDQPYLASITGTGSLQTALIGCFLGAIEDDFVATVTALGVMGVCAELADSENGPMEFQSSLMERIEKLSPAVLRSRLKLKKVTQD